MSSPSGVDSSTAGWASPSTSGAQQLPPGAVALVRRPHVQLGQLERSAQPLSASSRRSAAADLVVPPLAGRGGVPVAEAEQLARGADPVALAERGDRPERRPAGVRQGEAGPVLAGLGRVAHGLGVHGHRVGHPLARLRAGSAG